MLFISINNILVAMDEPTVVPPTQNPEFNLQPQNIPPVIQPEPEQGRKARYVLIILVLIALIAAAAAYYLWNQKDSPTAGTTTNTKLSLPNQPKQLNEQFSMEDFSSGYVAYSGT